MLIGSRAIAHWNKEFVARPDADWDIIGYYYEDAHWREKLNIPKDARIEWHNPDDLNNSVLVSRFSFDGICLPIGLAVIYRSHLWRDHNWDGHIAKYWKYIATLHDPDIMETIPLLEVTKERIKLTKEKFPQGNPNLNQSNMDFFEDKVQKVYDHDSIHELYAYEDRPMFERLKKPEKVDLAWCEKDLWVKLTKEQQNKCVAEETYVIATERFMVPKNWSFPTKFAYYLALRKVCTTLCSGWFRDHAIDNFPDIMSLYSDEKFFEVKTRLENGEGRPYREN